MLLHLSFRSTLVAPLAACSMVAPVSAQRADSGQNPAAAPPAGPAASLPAATFRAQVDMVSIAAVVRDEHGRAVASLGRGDFDVREDGHAVPVLEVRSEHDAPANVALLVGGSGTHRLLYP